MARKVLILASVASMIDQFNMPNIHLLQGMGYAVDVACNFKEGNTCSDERVIELRRTLKKMDVHCYQIDFARDITNIGRNIKALWQVEAILDKNNYVFVHCHSPIGGVVGRLAGKKAHTKVIYTAHGFHFFKGAPLKNWLIYYPVEKICSCLTDALICINKEDYVLAKKKIKARKIEYVPGVGVDLDRFGGQNYHAELVKKMELRQSIGVGKNAVLFLSVGELNRNKNHSVMIKALGELQKNNEKLDLQYAIAGKGVLEAELKQFAKKCGVADRVHFLGYRNDIADWYQAADVFVHPSKREGLPVSLMEAMASGLPCVVSRIRGNVDLVDEGKGGFCFESKKTSDLISAIDKIMACNRKKMADYNVKKMQHYGLQAASHRMEEIYMSIGSRGK